MHFEKAFSSFSVDDVARARAFYADTLRVEVADDPMGLVLRPPGAGDIFVYEKPDHAPATHTVLNFRVDDIARAHRELTDAGIRFEVYEQGEIGTDARGILAGQGMKIAWFRDPAGNFLSIIEEDE